MDLTLYIALSLAPLLAERWGARALALGLLPFAWGLMYSATAVFGGRVSDRVSRTATARGGLLLFVAVCVFFHLAREPWHFYLGMPCVAVAMAFFWPALQAAIADESDPDTLSHHLGWFNVCWGLGKGLGVLAGGILLEVLGQPGFLVAAGAGVLIFLLMPRVPRGGGGGTPFETGTVVVPAATRRSFRAAALIGNFAAFGLGTTLINQYTEWNSALGRGGLEYGFVVGGVFLSQGVAFALLLRFSAWPYRRAPHLILQVLSGLSALLLATTLPVPALAPLVLLVGGGLGMSYYASIYYSLDADTGRGGRAGLHEAVLGTGNFLVPLAAGALARAFDSARLPALFAAGVVLAAAAAQALLLRRARVQSSAS